MKYLDSPAWQGKFACQAADKQLPQFIHDDTPNLHSLICSKVSAGQSTALNLDMCLWNSPTNKYFLWNLKIGNPVLNLYGEVVVL